MDAKTLKEKYVYQDGGFCSAKTGRRLSGSEDSGGRIQMRICGKNYLVHRMVWLWFHGELPADDLDHINRDPKDNRIENLRVVNRSQNKQNSGMYATNKSGYRGVSLAGKWGTWKAQISVGNAKKYLGSFATPELAYQAYLDAAKRLHTHSSIDFADAYRVNSITRSAPAVAILIDRSRQTDASGSAIAGPVA